MSYRKEILQWLEVALTIISVGVKLEVLITSISVDLWKIHRKQAVTEVTIGFFGLSNPS